ncbi:DUF4268 domain-containing protein [Prosthecobacter vanneervenii]|uniref:DUF4268 domain-containing protein n=1 Tax=Prosthecobacter vanneervenii TaxID=48466 RepID=A0A7W8DMU8_9BACT|nr:DUF4268 domain-containing protein [Prosthecobacter vanneervenii]MBB5035211.1 hypothetical protein [Prosthecobacter vanneervenii]
MYQIDPATNRIHRVAQMKFADLGFTERGHLQEWLANQPDALGEELLIVQKEFAGFEDTRERLDLLALDKDGALVVIENKLDDSGRDVVWQSLKYASYCSTLSKTAIADIFQQYLDKSGIDARAEEKICEFLGQEDFAEVMLNHGNDQRLILVAAQFRKEVTSTVLWLLKHDVRLQCFKATPFKQGNFLFLQLEQVIPLAEAEELMIGISEKEKEEHKAERGQAKRFPLRTEFWHRALEALEQAGIDLYSNVSPGKDHWLNSGSGLSGVHYTMVFSKDEVRVEFVLSRSAKEQNKTLFDTLYQRCAALEQRFGEPLEWRRLDEKKASIILARKLFDGYNKDNWADMIKWLVERVQRMEETFEPEIALLRGKLNGGE